VVATVATLHPIKQENHLEVSYLSIAVRLGACSGGLTLSTGSVN